MDDYLTKDHETSAHEYLEHLKLKLKEQKKCGTTSIESDLTECKAKLHQLKVTNLFAAQKLCETVLESGLTAPERFIYGYELCDILFSLGPFSAAKNKAEAYFGDQKDMCNDLQYKFCVLLGHINRVTGKLSLATECYHKAEEVALRMDDSSAIVTSFIYQQLCIYSRGDNKEPLKNLLPLLEKSPLGIDALITLHQALGNIYRSAADWHNAKLHFKQAIKLAKNNGNVCKAIECKAELGRAYRSSGCHAKALKRQTKLLDFALSRGDIFNVANACGYIGFTYYSMGEAHYMEAVKFLYCKLYLSKNDLGDLSGYRWCLNNIGKVYLALKEFDRCQKLFSESAKIARQLDNMLGLGTAYGNLGSTYRALGKHAEAINCHEKYLTIAKSNSDTGGVAIMQRELILDHLYLYGGESDLEKKKSLLNDARSYAFKALRTSLEVRSRLGQEDDIMKIGNFEHNQAKIYSLLLYILIQQEEYEAGLVLSDLGRAHAIADKINSKFKVNSSFLTDIVSILANDETLNYAALSSVLKKMGKLIGSSHMLVYTLLENPLAILGKESFLYMWHVQGVPSGMGVEVHFQQSVLSSGNQPVIDERYVSDCLSSQEQSTSEEATTPRDIVRRKSPKFQAATLSSEHKKDALEVLYDLLIYPISQYMDTATRLIIIPHKFLFRVPFSALKSRRHSFLVEDYVISLTPSLYILDIAVQRGEEWSRLAFSEGEIKVLAVGNPKMPENEFLDLRQLPDAEEEVKFISTLFGGSKLLYGEGATKRAVINLFPNYPVIHMATHAIKESSLGEYITNEDQKSDSKSKLIGDYSIKGAIILAKSDSLCSGVLTSSEIECLHLNSTCELVVLSCCNTASGEITGDGILGLSRSLMCAGVMNMVVTLKKIPDKSTSSLMRHFYHQYRTSRDAAAALRLSMLQFISEKKDVQLWAVFSCIGIGLKSLDTFEK